MLPSIFQSKRLWSHKNKCGTFTFLQLSTAKLTNLKQKWKIKTNHPAALCCPLHFLLSLAIWQLMFSYSFWHCLDSTSLLNLLHFDNLHVTLRKGASYSYILTFLLTIKIPDTPLFDNVHLRIRACHINDHNSVICWDSNTANISKWLWKTHGP